MCSIGTSSFFVAISLTESTEFFPHKILYTFLSNMFYIRFNFMFLEVDDPLPSDIKKQVDILDPLLFPKREDYPMRTFSSILVPCKIEPDSQEFGSTSPSDQGKNFRVRGSTK